MFINHSNGPIINRSISSRGPDRTKHNDENMSTLFHQNNSKSKRSNTGGLKQRVPNPKTPSNSTNPRRRALGDISNRKSANQIQQRESFFQTPHKTHIKLKNSVSNHINARKNNSTKKKSGKKVTFLNQNTQSNIIPAKQIQRRKQQTISSSLAKGGTKNENKSRECNTEDVELPAGRGWIEEQSFIGNDDLSLASLDCKNVMADYKAIEESEENACRKEMQHHEDRCEELYQDKMREFTEMTRFEGFSKDGMIYIENLENDLINFDADRLDTRYDCFSYRGDSDCDSISL